MEIPACAASITAPLFEARWHPRAWKLGILGSKRLSTIFKIFIDQLQLPSCRSLGRGQGVTTQDELQEKNCVQGKKTTILLFLIFRSFRSTIAHYLQLIQAKSGTQCPTEPTVLTAAVEGECLMYHPNSSYMAGPILIKISGIDESNPEHVLQQKKIGSLL